MNTSNHDQSCPKEKVCENCERKLYILANFVIDRILEEHKKDGLKGIKKKMKECNKYHNHNKSVLSKKI